MYETNNCTEAPLRAKGRTSLPCRFAAPGTFTTAPVPLRTHTARPPSPPPVPQGILPERPHAYSHCSRRLRHCSPDRSPHSSHSRTPGLRDLRRIRRLVVRTEIRYLLSHRAPPNRHKKWEAALLRVLPSFTF